MKVIVCGSKELNCGRHLEEVIDDSGFDIDEIVVIESRGINKLARNIADKRGISLKVFKEHKDIWGYESKMFRDMDMIKYADAIIGVWDGKCQESGKILSLARKNGLERHIEIVGMDDYYIEK
jgi:hypothetical protein